MENTTFFLTLDRTENGMLVLLDEYENRYLCPAQTAAVDDTPYEDGTVFRAETDGAGAVLSLTPDMEKTASRRAALKEKRRQLLFRSKNRKDGT